MARFLVLIYGDEREWDNASPAEQRRIDDGHAAFVAKAGVAVLSGGALQSTAAAVSLRAGPAGEPLATDGPFAETREVVGGYYLLEAPDLEAAVSLAGSLPEVAAAHSGVEVRPLREAG